MQYRKNSCSSWGVTSDLGWNWVNNVYRCEFLFIFFNSFFKLLYYGYEICLKNIERICAVVEELLQIWVEIGWTMSTGTSFCSFSFILFLNCSTIATKSTYKISKGSMLWLRSYINFGLKWGINGYRYEFLLVSHHSFLFSLYYSYKIHLPIF